MRGERSGAELALAAVDYLDASDHEDERGAMLDALDEYEQAGTPEPAGRTDRLQAWVGKTHTMDADTINAVPVPREALLGGYFPPLSTSAIVAAGGVGKSLFAIWLSARHANDDTHVLIVSAEDGEADYQAKIHNLVEAGSIGRGLSDIAGKIHVLNLKGEGVKLIAEMGGSFVPSIHAETIVQLVRQHYPRVRVVIFETLSRFAGGEDNDRMEAVVSACDHIAIGISGASVLVHHMGKGQTRENVVDLYSGRGGSTLGDNTRSFVVLTRLSSGDKGYRGALPTVIDPDDIEAGRAFEVLHVRHSYGPTQPPAYFIHRQGPSHGPVLESVPIATDADVIKARVKSLDRQYDAAATRLHGAIKAKGGRVERKFFETDTRELIGVTQKQGRKLIDEMIEAGTLVVVDQAIGNTTRKYLEIGRAG